MSYIPYVLCMKPGEFLYSLLLIMPKVPSLLTVTHVLQFHRHAENHMKFLLDIPRLIGFVPIEKNYRNKIFSSFLQRFHELELQVDIKLLRDFQDHVHLMRNCLYLSALQTGRNKKLNFNPSFSKIGLYIKSQSVSMTFPDQLFNAKQCLTIIICVATGVLIFIFSYTK